MSETRALLAVIGDIERAVLENDDFNLSEWEEQFISQMKGFLDSQFSTGLTEKQEEKLFEIWEKSKR